MQETALQFDSYTCVDSNLLIFACDDADCEQGGNLWKPQKISISLKSVKTSWHTFDGCLVTYHGLLYIIINLTMWALTTFKGFRIGVHIQEKTCVWKVTLGMKHPVQGVCRQAGPLRRRDRQDAILPKQARAAGKVGLREVWFSASIKKPVLWFKNTVFHKLLQS